ncbi:hypothetical protein [Streptomyces sp. NBC_00328]|nr:hypothetical protein [Streptomyces sp. NBC_00328]
MPRIAADELFCEKAPDAEPDLVAASRLSNLGKGDVAKCEHSEG